MRLWLTKTPNGLRPSDEASEETYRRFKLGQIYRADVVKPREHRSLRRYWGLVKIVYQNSDQFRSEDQVHQFLKIRAGHCTEIVSKATGEIFLVADSINYDTLDEAEFEDVWMRIVKAVCEDILPGIDEQELEYEILKIIGAAA